MSLYVIAGLTVSMSPVHRLTSARAERYRVSEGTADLVLSGGGDASEEYAALARSFYEQLLSFDGFLLHASAVELGGKAYAFSASSGTGKSTHAAFWCRELGALTVNDDKPAVRLINGTFCACGTPFSGKTDQSRNVAVPLGAIVMLRRGEQTAVRRMTTQEALFGLLDQTLRPHDTEGTQRLLTLLEQLLTAVPVFEAAVPNHPSAARDVKEALDTYERSSIHGF